jgi:hypothetical protein
VSFLEVVRIFAETHGEEMPDLFKRGLGKGVSISVFVGWMGHHQN